MLALESEHCPLASSAWRRQTWQNVSVLFVALVFTAHIRGEVVPLPRISRYSVGGMPQALWKAIEKALGLV
jgi:hypothetical protein